MGYDKFEINHEKIAQLASRARRIKYFLQMHVHATSSERSCENAHLYRIDLAFAARMYVQGWTQRGCLRGGGGGGGGGGGALQAKELNRAGGKP